jgi:hypothetical protein
LDPDLRGSVDPDPEKSRMAFTFQNLFFHGGPGASPEAWKFFPELRMENLYFFHCKIAQFLFIEKLD